MAGLRFRNPQGSMGNALQGAAQGVQAGIALTLALDARRREQDRADEQIRQFNEQLQREDRRLGQFDRTMDLREQAFQAERSDAEFGRTLSLRRVGQDDRALDQRQQGIDLENRQREQGMNALRANLLQNGLSVDEVDRIASEQGPDGLIYRLEQVTNAKDVNAAKTTAAARVLQAAAQGIIPQNEAEAYSQLIPLAQDRKQLESILAPLEKKTIEHMTTQAETNRRGLVLQTLQPQFDALEAASAQNPKLVPIMGTLATYAQLYQLSASDPAAGRYYQEQMAEGIKRGMLISMGMDDEKAPLTPADRFRNTGAETLGRSIGSGELAPDDPEVSRLRGMFGIDQPGQETSGAPAEKPPLTLKSRKPGQTPTGKIPQRAYRILVDKARGLSPDEREVFISNQLYMMRDQLPEMRPAEVDAILDSILKDAEAE